MSQGMIFHYAAEVGTFQEQKKTRYYPGNKGVTYILS